MSQSLSVFRGNPRWAMVALAVIVFVTGLVMAWNISFSGYSSFYSSAARSMSGSWRACAFGAFDPSATVTLDKLSGFLVPQAISAWLFGFHAWSIALPQVIEGMATVVAAFVIGTRWRSAPVGLLAAAATGTMPLFASMFGHAMEDGLVTMSLALALLCCQSAIISGRMLPLLLSALWVAVGFQSKMMQAWLILPALAVAYFLGAPNPVAQKLRRLLAAGAVALVLSLSWMTAIQLVPPADRPYIDGSTNNNTYSMVFGYNGFNRVIPNLIPGAVGDTAGSTDAAKSKLVPADGRDASPSASSEKLVLPVYLTQIGWLYPLAIAGLVLGVIRRKRPPAERALVIGLGIWLTVGGALLTAIRIPHTAYLAAIGVQLALLSAIGVAEAVRRYRAGNRWLLPLLLIVETGWTAWILLSFPQSPPCVLPAVLVLGLGSALALLVLPSGRPARVVVTIGIVASLFAPLIWTGWTLAVTDNGSAGDAYAGPRSSAGARISSGRPGQFRVGVPLRSTPDPRLTAAQLGLVGYLQKNAGTGPLLTTQIWGLAAPYILDAGLDVVPMGGFSGQVPTPTVNQLAANAAAGSVRFVLLNAVTAPGGSTPHFGIRVATKSNSSLLGRWVRANCERIPQSRFESTGVRLPAVDLFDCAGG